MKLEEEIVPVKNSIGYEAMKKASQIAEENGISEMTLDEINSEIIDCRSQGNI